MSECYYGEIRIGGSFTDKKLLPEFLGELSDAGCAARFFKTKEGKEYLELYDDQAYYGQFPSLEEWLIKHLVPFSRYSSQYGDEYPAGIKAYDGNVEFYTQVDSDTRRPLLGLEGTLRGFLEEIENKTADEYPLVAAKTENDLVREFASRNLTGSQDLAAFLMEQWRKNDPPEIPGFQIDAAGRKKIKAWIKENNK